MNIETIKKLLKERTVPSINRMIGSSYRLDSDVKQVKLDILRDECNSRYMKLCEDDVDRMMVILEDETPITDEQRELLDVLHEVGEVAKMLKPPVIEERENDEEISDDTDKNKWIGVDLDGTLAYYEKFEGPCVIGEPIKPMVDRVKKWLENGLTVKIMTARVANKNDSELDDIKKAISDWCVENIGRKLDVTCQKDENMEELWDDRAITVIKNTGKIINED